MSHRGTPAWWASRRGPAVVRPNSPLCGALVEAGIQPSYRFRESDEVRYYRTSPAFEGSRKPWA